MNQQKQLMCFTASVTPVNTRVNHHQTWTDDWSDNRMESPDMSFSFIVFVNTEDHKQQTTF